MINIQPIEKRDLRADGLISLHSIFHTIQGEGPFCGTPATFIRLAGCNLQCPMCDTDYTSNRDLLSPIDIAQAAYREAALYRKNRSPSKPYPWLVVITGGEPFRQNLSVLVTKLLAMDAYVQIETNGTLAPTIPLDLVGNQTHLRSGAYIVCSPKTGKVHPQIAFAACCFKYVLDHRSVDPETGLPILALNHPAHPQVARPPNNRMQVYLQPVDTGDPLLNEHNVSAVVKSCMQYGYTLQLQIHKLVGVD